MTTYRGMTADEFVEFLLDENGLLEFVNVQLRGVVPVEEHHWREVARRISHLSEKHWQPTGEYVQMLYALQTERVGRKAQAA